MMPNDRCSSCGSTETEILYESEAILSVCKVCRVVRSKSWFCQSECSISLQLAGDFSQVNKPTPHELLWN
jgi:hypothetical protein